MALNIKRLLLVLSATGVISLQALASELDRDTKYLTVSKMRVSEVSKDFFGQNKIEELYQKEIKAQGLPNEYGQVDPVEQAGKVITVSRDLVALGEDIYRLVIKGKPNNNTSYSPISVIPRIDGQPVDLLDTEKWSAPVKRTYDVVYENAYGMEVVKFKYSVIYSYKGSYNGTGSYLTSVQIIPESIRTLFGFDFTATMKLGGIQNQGTKANPIAAATLLMEYSVSSLVVANSEVDSFFITGSGQFKKL